MKGYFVYRGGGGNYYCTAVLENGWAFASHLCSHPNFAAGDLYFGRPERIKIISELIPEGIEWQPIMKESDIPSSVIEANKEKRWPQEWSDKFMKALGEAPEDK